MRQAVDVLLEFVRLEWNSVSAFYGADIGREARGAFAKRCKDDVVELVEIFSDEGRPARFVVGPFFADGQ